MAAGDQKAYRQNGHKKSRPGMGAAYVVFPAVYMW
jgi:hypothetical protein